MPILHAQDVRKALSLVPSDRIPEELVGYGRASGLGTSDDRRRQAGELIEELCGVREAAPPAASARSRDEFERRRHYDRAREAVGALLGARPDGSVSRSASIEADPLGTARWAVDLALELLGGRLR